jgi:hypothetical protein
MKEMYLNDFYGMSGDVLLYLLTSTAVRTMCCPWLLFYLFE